MANNVATGHDFKTSLTKVNYWSIGISGTLGGVFGGGGTFLAKARQTKQEMAALQKMKQAAATEQEAYQLGERMPNGLLSGEGPGAALRNGSEFHYSSNGGLPSGVGGTGAAYNKATGQGVYLLRDEAGLVKYVGRGDAPARLLRHATDTQKGSLVGEILWENNLTKAQAKGLEQRLMMYFGGAKSVDPTTNLFNRIRSYSLSNPNAGHYSNSGTGQIWEETLRRLGQ